MAGSKSSWRGWAPEAKLRLLTRLQAETWRQRSHPGQLPPAELGKEGRHVWYARGGRGSGKTRTGAETLSNWVFDYPAGEWGIVAPTFGDARDTCVEGESGLLAVLGGNRADPGPLVDTWNRSIGELVLINGAQIYLDGADDGALRIQGRNLRGAWLDEIGLFRKWRLAWDESISFAVRKDPALVVATGTPKGRQGLVKLLLEDPDVVMSKLDLRENEDNLSAARMDALRRRYAGTRLGRQELEGEILGDVEGALWRLSQIDADRVTELPPKVDRIVVAIDPSASSGEEADETGIVAVAAGGHDFEGHAFPVADRSGRYTPTEWATAAIDLYHELGADRIIAERNNGGEMVEAVLRAVDPDIPYRSVWASRGKQTRAEPISALYEQHRVHHVEALPDLESEMTTWTPTDDDSPGRMDALVWAVTELLLGGGEATIGTLDPENRTDDPAPSLTGDLLDRVM